MNNFYNKFDEKDKKILALEKEIQELKSTLEQSEKKRLQCQDETLLWRMKHEDLETAYYKLKYGRVSTS